MNTKKFLIIILLVAVGILGYNYFSKETTNTPKNKEAKISQNEENKNGEEGNFDTTPFISFLDKYITKNQNEEEKTTTDIEEVDLNNDGKNDAIVLLKGMNWCGTGGCTVVVFENKNGEYKEISTIPTSDTFFVDKKITNNWKEIKITTSGGGYEPALETYIYKNGAYVKKSEIELKKIAQNFAENSEEYKKDGEKIELKTLVSSATCENCYEYEFEFMNKKDSKKSTIKVRVEKDGTAEYIK